MSREEFHRRYESDPCDYRAELIQGVVYVSSPVRAPQHGEPHADIIGWLHTYRRKHPELQLLDNATVILGDHEVQPDAALRRLEGGTSVVDGAGYVVGPPELVVEIAASSVSIDAHDKKETYRQAGVQEYVIWRVEDRAIDWFLLDNGEYLRVEPTSAGRIESTQFSGLVLETGALLAGDVDDVARAVE
jgi:Uma2 family endonuclease